MLVIRTLFHPPQAVHRLRVIGIRSNAIHRFRWKNHQAAPPDNLRAIDYFFKLGKRGIDLDDFGLQFKPFAGGSFFSGLRKDSPRKQLGKEFSEVEEELVVL